MKEDVALFDLTMRTFTTHEDAEMKTRDAKLHPSAIMYYVSLVFVSKVESMLGGCHHNAPFGFAVFLEV